MPDKIKVKVGGRKYSTKIDNIGTQRFEENSVLRFLVDEKIINLNKLGIAYQEGKFTQRDYAEFYMMIGYSVSGFSELSFFEDYDIENPLWTK